MSDPREVEAKFEIDAESIALLATIERIGEFVVQSRRAVSQQDLYFDTASGELAQARASLRIRNKATGAEITYKGSKDEPRSADEAHIASRLEDEVRVDGEVAERVRRGDWSDSDEQLSPIRRAREICRAGALQPTADMLNDRIVVTLVSEDGQELEMAIDTCTGKRLVDGRETRFNELELESKGADHEALVRAATELQLMLPGIRPNHRTKLERVLQ